MSLQETPAVSGCFPLEKTQEAIRRENLGGWLFSGFRSREKLSLSLLKIDPHAKNTRPWYYFVFASGEPVKVVHAIEKNVLAPLPGETCVYASRGELARVLRDAVLPRLSGRALACQYSAELPILSYLDHGTALFLEGLGFTLASSAALVQRFQGLLDDEGMASHSEAARVLYDAVASAWEKLERVMARGGEATEGTILAGILEELGAAGLTQSPGLIIASGPNSCAAHYAPPAAPGEGRRIEKNEIIQFDIWAKKKTPGAVYADISWVGFTGKTPPENYIAEFAAIVRSRDAAVDLIASRFAEGRPVRGSEVDAYVKNMLAEAGYGGVLRHRTGHGIDTKVHGSGVNLDSAEFPDERLLLEGSCFSVEPGIYFAGHGMRTEINVVIKDGEPVISGREPQRELLLFH